MSDISTKLGNLETQGYPKKMNYYNMSVQMIKWALRIVRLHYFELS